MRKQFINRPLIVSLVVSSAFIAFVSTFGTLHFRQEAFIHAENLKKIEKHCNRLESETLALLAKVTQMQTSYYLKQKLLAFPANTEQIFYVRRWSDYKGSHMTRNALAMNVDRQLFP